MKINFIINPTAIYSNDYVKTLMTYSCQKNILFWDYQAAFKLYFELNIMVL